MRIPGLHWHGDGYCALDGPLLALADELDGRFLACAGRELAPYGVPTFIALADLAPVGYLRSFPHLATFAASLARDCARTAAFAAAHEHADSLEVGTALESVRQVLTPAACYHPYHRMAGRELPADLYLTVRAHCHRREDTYAALERQACFQMRELVCIGSPESVEAFVSGCRKRVDALARDLGVGGRWMTATDPFFDAAGDPKAVAQRVDPVKSELTLDGGLALASINRHRAFFGERYRIRRLGVPAHSACVAFGIERWLLAIVRSRGTNPAAWSLSEEVAT